MFENIYKAKLAHHKYRISVQKLKCQQQPKSNTRNASQFDNGITALPYLCSEIVFRLEAENLDGCNVQVDQDVFERGSVARLRSPALLDQQLVAFGACSRYRQLERVGPYSKNDGRAVDILLGEKTAIILPYYFNSFHGVPSSLTL